MFKHCLVQCLFKTPTRYCVLCVIIIMYTSMCNVCMLFVCLNNNTITYPKIIKATQFKCQQQSVLTVALALTRATLNLPKHSSGNELEPG